MDTSYNVMLNVLRNINELRARVDAMQLDIQKLKQESATYAKASAVDSLISKQEVLEESINRADSTIYHVQRNLEELPTAQLAALVAGSDERIKATTKPTTLIEG